MAASSTRPPSPADDPSAASASAAAGAAVPTSGFGTVSSGGSAIPPGGADVSMALVSRSCRRVLPLRRKEKKTACDLGEGQG